MPRSAFHVHSSQKLLQSPACERTPAPHRGPIHEWPHGQSQSTSLPCFERRRTEHTAPAKLPAPPAPSCRLHGSLRASPGHFRGEHIGRSEHIRSKYHPLLVRRETHIRLQPVIVLRHIYELFGVEDAAL